MPSYEVTTASAAEMHRFREWADEEGWNPGRSDIVPFHTADPRGFFLGRLDGEPVVSVSGVRYGTDFGFIGFYIARPAVRGQGYGIRIWRTAMRHLDGRNIGLDGVVQQQENYRRSGFRRVWTHVRYAGVPAGAEASAGVRLVDGRDVPFDRLAEYDRRFFPAEREAFLSQWIGLPSHTSLAAVRDGRLQGFAVMRPATVGSRIGPLHAASQDIASALVHGLTGDTPDEPVALDVPDINTPSVELMERLGLEPTFECARMYTGPTPDVDSGGIFAVTTLELG
ncbi:GNAT family N-acetyltransferase [Streptomyces poonensis]|uniref:N-acetyltransferase GCN5 n=1 Tax=Streptomyces poonensis TaxID=68255 RepID=A0A918UEZ0_9ACTN|nr:GNAT family N-acetyltransferase [Streptomyces poonensis]GGY98433.1 N-acetyltransferase GCN5 [Streptomyces poonensis]